MKLHESLGMIYNELPLKSLDKEKADWLSRNMQKAIWRAEQLEKFAETFNSLEAQAKDLE